jgi:probable F420-dependent oxidoreductase
MQVKVGIVYPQIELNGDPRGVDRIGRATEELGYDHFLMYDHVVGAARDVERDRPLVGGMYTDKDPFHDPFVAFAYLAGITKRIEFVTGILILPQRPTVLVAKQAADLDLLSGGRLRLGVGTGWNYVEYDALGQPFEARGARMTEQIPYLRQLWSESLVTFEGRFEKMDRGNILPRPNRQIPIYHGGYAEPALKRGAKMCDGFIFPASFENSAKPGLTRIKQLLEEYGRPLEPFGRHWLMQDDTGAGLSVGASADAVRRWQDLGGTEVSVVTMGLGFKTIDQHIDHITEVRHKVGAL